MKSSKLRHIVATAVTAAALAFPNAGWASFAEGEEAYLKQDYWAAFLKFAELSKQGDAPAQAVIGRIYFEGKGAPLDYRAAARSYEKAASQGNATAQYQLATMYAAGVGVKQDPARAVQLMEQSAEQGVPWAMYSLGLMYKDGAGVSTDTVKALKWISLAAASPESAATAEYVKLARTAKAELESSMPAESRNESQRLARLWSASKHTRDTAWQKAINQPLAMRAPEGKTADAPADKNNPATPFTRDYYPQNK